MSRARIPAESTSPQSPASGSRPPTRRPELSIVIPVYNGSETIAAVVAEIDEVFRGRDVEIVLVNDGSRDDSEAACSALVEQYGGAVRFVQLARNFGEHNAVLAGLQHSAGDCVAVLDDDGQTPAADALRLYDTLRASGVDVVYGRYAVKHHSVARNLGSWFTDRLATVMLKKPPGLYLSSFKVMNRFLVDQVCTYRGARPYVDGLIYRTTRSIGQIDVAHRSRIVGRSNYGPRRLVGLWLDTFLTFSILPLRLAGVLGLACSLMSLPLLVAIVIDKIWLNPGVTLGVPTVVAAVVFFAGVQLLILGTIGEYLGRLFLDYSGTPQYVVRYIKEPDDGAG